MAIEKDEAKAYWDAMEAFWVYESKKGLVECALSYRMPEKVDKSYDEKGNACYQCPNCDEELAVIGANYCMECGQALEWEASE